MADHDLVIKQEELVQSNPLSEPSIERKTHFCNPHFDPLSNLNPPPHHHHHHPLIPMPVDYEDFQFPLTHFQLSLDQQVNSSINNTSPNHHQSLNYPTTIHSFDSIHPFPNHNNCQSSSIHQNQFHPSHLNQNVSLLPQFLNQTVSFPSNSNLNSNSIDLNSELPSPIHLNHSSHDNYSLPIIPSTPPPLFNSNEHDLLSSFFNIFNNVSHDRSEFDPQGMPENMPVLGELKRRLEQDHSSLQFSNSFKPDTSDDVQVETRLNLKDSDSIYPQTRRPSLQSFHTTSGSLSNSSSSDSHLYQDQTRKKRAKTTNLINSFQIHPSNHLIQNLNHSMDSELNLKLQDWDSNPSFQLGDWPLPHQITTSHSDCFEIPKSLSQSAPLSPVSIPKDILCTQVNHLTSFESQSSNNSIKINPSPSCTHSKSSTKRPGKKLPKSTHIVSEQRRRNAIQGGFGNLVEILRAGEAMSGISIAIVDPSPNPNSNPSTNSKPKTRGRGRRGEIETGASKSVVLEKAAEFVQWMVNGNLALKNEIKRVESILKNYHVDI